ncbi:MAG: TonB-dependent receptor [Bacteroides sp.]|nr:TonB-dependent receptor [Bacteroides sp.]
MITQEVSIRSNVTVTLKVDAHLIDEVMVVAYGTAKKESFTGSASIVSTDKLEKRAVSNISKALDGQVTGLMAASGGGQPGDDANLMIRGFGSINASTTPLYVVDGVPYDTNKSMAGNLSALNSADIESIAVLKDASAGALYGSRGANGVIIITTKRAKDNKTSVNYKGSIGWANRGIKRYKTVDQKDYVQLYYEGKRNGYVFDNQYDWDTASSMARNALSTDLGGEVYNPFKNYTWDTLIDASTGKIHPDAESVWDENWLDAAEKKNALRHEHNFSVTGGTDKMKASFSLGYLNENGVLKTMGFERYTGRLNVDIEGNKWLKTGLSATFAHTDQNYAYYTDLTTSNVWYSAQFIAPIYPVYMKDENGADLLNSLGERQFDYGASRPTQQDFNSIATLYDDQSYRKTDNLSGRTYITTGSDSEDAGWARGLKFSANLGVDFRNRNAMIYYNMYHGNQANANGLIYKRNYRTFSYTFNQLLTWNRTFGDHSLDVLAGHEFYDYEYNYLSAAKSNLADSILELRPGTTLRDADSYTNTYRIQSYLSRFNYNYKEKYYFSASWRTDGSSRFHKDNRWGNFWSVGANWRISQEAFMDEIEWIDNLSVKASYGVQGNDGILDAIGYDNYYAWQSLYDLYYANANNSGALIASLENKNLTWEKNGNLNIGLEARLLNSRLDLSVEYYNRKTTDMLLEYPLALSTGFSGYNANVGSMRNSGVEFMVAGSLIRKRNFDWRLTFMGSTVKNKVLKLTTESPEIISGVHIIKEGMPLHTFYMAKSAGVDPATGAQLYWAYESMDEKGNAINEYITDDYSVATTNKYYHGDRLPDLYGSIGTDLTYKGFDLSVLTTYSIGGKVYDSLYASAMNVTYTGNTWHEHALRRWQKPGDITDVPRISTTTRYAVTDRFLVNASYFAIKNITFGYTFPKTWMQKAGIQSLRLSCSLDNLALFTHMNGMDPQYNFSGGTNYSYAPNKVYTIGVDINF